MNLTDLRKLNNDSKDKLLAAQSVEALYKETSDAYLKYHRDWYIYERFVRGDHWVVFNKTTNKIQNLPLGDGEIRRTVNKIRSQVRSIKNFIKRNQPRWEAHPTDITDEAFEEARKNNKIMQNIYKTRRFPLLLTDIIVNSLKYSIGILEGGIVKKDGQDYLDFWCDDTFDIFFDPSATCVQDCRFIIKAISKPITYIQEFYGVKEIAADNKEAASEYKDWLLKEISSKGENKGSKDLETAIIKELWIKWVEGGKTKIKIITACGDKVLKIQETRFRRYPFFIYTPERTANQIIGEAWIKDLISLNKSLDKVTSQVETYIQRMLGGKYLIKQGVEVSMITDGGAEKIYYKGNTPPTQQNLQPLPSAIANFSQGIERWIEEFGGAREATLGRVPGSLQSGKGVEALQAADAATVSESVENLEWFLSDVAEFCSEIIEDYNVASEEIIEGNEKIKFIGNVENPPENTMVVRARKFDVKIVPEVAYTEEARKDWVMRLAEAGILDPQTVLEFFSFSNIEDIIARVKQREQEKFKEDMVKQRESHRTDGNAPEDTADLANQENMAMAAGQAVPLTPQALWTPEHTELHNLFIKENKSAYEQNMDMWNEHLANEQQYMDGGEQPMQQPMQ
jgi:hypothetical protein